MRRSWWSREEMESFVEMSLRLNSSDPTDATQQPVPLPWTDEEELVIAITGADQHPMGKASSWLRLAALLLAFVSAAVGLIRMLSGTRLSVASAKGGKSSSWACMPGIVSKADHQWV